MTQAPRTERRVSAPLVLAVSSGMVAIGLVAAFAYDAPAAVERDRQERARVAALVLDDRTPEAVSESFLDAWRRRAWDEAARMASGDALAATQTKKAADEALDPTDRAMARDVWERLASAPLEVQFTRSAEWETTGFVLDGIAAYDLLGTPYRREMRWFVRREGELYRVERMENGRVLTEMPELMRGAEE